MPQVSDPGDAPSDALHLARELGVSITLADVLHRRGFSADAETRRFLDPKLSQLTQPSGMADRQEATERIARAVQAGESICVFGDYDCDGITATAVMTSVLRDLGATVLPLLATRREGAYGLSEPALDRVLATGAKLLVTCDCGSSDHERLARAKRSGLDAVVIDHHLVPDDPLPVTAFLNPHRPECEFPYKGLASCGLALSIAAALRQKLGVDLDLRPLLDMVAIGTVADVAPLDGDNRALVRAGLGVLGAGTRPGIRALADLAKMELGRGVTAEDIAFRIAPRLNAPGRLVDPDESLALLLSPDGQTAAGLAATIEQLTQQRRAMQAEILEQAEADIEDAGWRDAPGLVLAREGWHPGIVGIVAGRIADETQRPTIVVGLEGARGRGSVRGPSGFPLYDALCRCKDALAGFGGHQAAAGVSVDAGRVEALRAAWADACTELGAMSFRAAPAEPDVRLDGRDDPSAVVRDLAKLEPCGEKNPAPRILIPAATLRAVRNLKGHLKMVVQYGSTTISTIAFQKGAAAESLREGDRVHLVGRLRRDHYRGGEAVEMHVERFETT